MNARLKEGTELLPLENVNAVELFTGKNLDALLAQIRAETATVVPDLTTASGRKEIASTAYKVARSKTAIDEAGKELVAGWKSQAAVVDASRKKARDYLDALKDEIRAPLDEWEAVEARKEQELIEQARLRREAEEAARIADIERREEEMRVKEEAIAAAERAVREKEEAEQREKDRIEREARLQAEATAKAERDAAAAIEAAKREAERAEGARVAAEAAAAESIKRAQREAADAAERAEAARIAAEKAAAEAQEKAVRDAEERIQRNAAMAAQAAKEAEAAQQAKDERKAAGVRHRATINRAAASALVKAGMDIETAKMAVTAIASGNVPCVSIQY
jgi:colicin import membrane protein